MKHLRPLVWGVFLCPGMDGMAQRGMDASAPMSRNAQNNNISSKNL